MTKWEIAARDDDDAGAPLRRPATLRDLPPPGSIARGWVDRQVPLLGASNARVVHMTDAVRALLAGHVEPTAFAEDPVTAFQQALGVIRAALDAVDAARIPLDLTPASCSGMPLALVPDLVAPALNTPHLAPARVPSPSVYPARYFVEFADTGPDMPCPPQFVHTAATPRAACATAVAQCAVAATVARCSLLLRVAPTTARGACLRAVPLRFLVVFGTEHGKARADASWHLVSAACDAADAVGQAVDVLVEVSGRPVILAVYVLVPSMHM